MKVTGDEGYLDQVVSSIETLSRANQKQTLLITSLR